MSKSSGIRQIKRGQFFLSAGLGGKGLIIKLPITQSRPPPPPSPKLTSLDSSSFPLINLC